MPEITTHGPELQSVDIECGGYPVLNALHPTPENTALHSVLAQRTRPFGDLKSEKIFVMGRQPGKAFNTQQIRIRSNAKANPYSLTSVIGALARMLQRKYDKSDEELRSWRLEKIAKVHGRKATFLCIFQDDENTGEPAVVDPPFIQEPQTLESVSAAETLVLQGNEWDEEQLNALETLWRILEA